MTSVDSTNFYINGHTVSLNDGIHDEQTSEGEIYLGAGDHNIQLDYFKGNRQNIKLKLMVLIPNASEYVLFKKPFSNSMDLAFGSDDDESETSDSNSEMIVVLMDSDSIDKGMSYVEDVASYFGDQSQVAENMVNETQTTEVGNPVFGWNENYTEFIWESYPQGQVIIATGQDEDHGLFTLPESLPWSIEDFIAGNVPQNQLDEIQNVKALANADLEALVGKKILAIVYKSDISHDTDSQEGNLQGERRGLFFFTVVEAKSPGNVSESESSSSLKDLLIQIDTVPVEYQQV